LQEAAARAFMLREVMGFETEEICTTLKITTNNCGVLLHRARIALRACLEHQWFLDGAEAK
jgi:RNA polymerase sigma-70 factor (ECF subfamily)